MRPSENPGLKCLCGERIYKKSPLVYVLDKTLIELTQAYFLSCVKCGTNWFVVLNGRTVDKYSLFASDFKALVEEAKQREWDVLMKEEVSDGK